MSAQKDTNKLLSNNVPYNILRHTNLPQIIIKSLKKTMLRLGTFLRIMRRLEDTIVSINEIVIVL